MRRKVRTFDERRGKGSQDSRENRKECEEKVEKEIGRRETKKQWKEEAGNVGKENAEDDEIEFERSGRRAEPSGDCMAVKAVSMNE